MKIAIITLTKDGVICAKKIKEGFPKADCYTLEKHVEEGFKIIFPSLSQLVHDIFSSYDRFLFVMAAGIVVRTIAPLIRHKGIDPGVLVMDEKGEFVISLLSGHMGGANELALKIASHMGATPVITTASDVQGTIAVDSLAEKLNCSIESLEDAKKITVQIIENKRVGIISEIPIYLSLKKNIISFDRIDEINLSSQEIEGLILISKEKPKDFSLPTVWLIPRDLVIGIGCKRGKTKEELTLVITEVLKESGFSLSRVGKIASVSIKEDEIGLLELSKSFKIPIIFLPIKAIREVEDLFEGSEFVKKTLGIKAVSEPCGYIGSNFGKCLVPVQKRNGITLSIWEKTYN